MSGAIAKPKVLLTVLGPLSGEQVDILDKAFPGASIKHEATVVVKGQPCAVFEILESRSFEVKNFKKEVS